MNLLVLNENDLLPHGLALVTQKRILDHVYHVLHATVGQQLKVGILNSIKTTATILHQCQRGLVLYINPLDPPESQELQCPQEYMQIPELHQIPKVQIADSDARHEEKTSIDLVLGIPRPKSLDKALQYAASMGVGNIFLLCSSRVQQCYLKSHQLSQEAIQKSLLLGLEQGAHTRLPEVHIFESMGRFCRYMQDKDYVRLIAHPTIATSLGGLKLQNQPPRAVLVAIGPEGGWLNYEIENFAKMGFS
ncbi:bifunctional Ribosomal RNA small subunit methyltransferase E/tRNA (guanine-N1-)-methyltransferase [Babesia duncani]|uniref:16S rRNA (uracil(1498)-N(3))-methyltransferase n=1 Tax=Babesia duncani TaxID=323732 RepID=A0AAD9PKD2_9APIC|nr:bifunctional Ribosomal RNA small subunit methyltransferase E/tRNA (guanine-N1-)-methyltransferase [Babesia duncani]